MADDPKAVPPSLPSLAGVTREDPHNDVLRDVTGALHDVSNALTVMLGWLGEARAPGATQGTIDDALRIIEQRARAARNLARRAIGAAPVAPDADEPLGPVIEEAIAALAVEAQRAGVRIVARGMNGEYARARVESAADITQVVTNLLLNALAHAPRGSELAVAIAASDVRVQVDVIDAGPGVSPKRRDSIFEGDSARRGGAGVGLRHARASARAAGGDLELIVVPSGGHFRLTWPRADAVLAAPRSVPRLKLFEGTHVLVVEDDAHVTQLLEAALVARGAQVTVARSAEELRVALAAPGPPHDAVLIDLSPIAADPDAAIASLRARAPLATMVVISGSAEVLPAPLQLASVRFVRKPFEVGEIVAALAAGRVPSPAPSSPGGEDV